MQVITCEQGKHVTNVDLCACLFGCDRHTSDGDGGGEVVVLRRVTMLTIA